MFIVYKATHKDSGTKYIGVTNNLKRRMKEHMKSPFPFGRALREFGIDSFEVSTEEYATLQEAYAREAELVTWDEARSDNYFNCFIGGVKTCKDDIMPVIHAEVNAMYDEDIKNSHPCLFTKDNNPMNNPDSKKKMISNQKSRKVSIEGNVFYGVREASRRLGMSRQKLIHRLKSDSFPEYFYL